MDNKAVIRKIESLGDQSRAELLSDISKFMGEYADPLNETEEAVSEALKDGFVYEALLNGARIGILVITRTIFTKFQPKYHLAYIAVSADQQGSGVGKNLLTQAVEATEGDIALHVEYQNEKAIKFYERNGWGMKYARLMPSKSTNPLTV